MVEPGIRIESLSREDRLALLERIWESLSRQPTGLPLSDARRAEVERRSRSLDLDAAHGGARGVPWDEVLRQLRARR